MTNGMHKYLWLHKFYKHGTMGGHGLEFENTFGARHRSRSRRFAILETQCARGVWGLQIWQRTRCIVFHLRADATTRLSGHGAPSFRKHQKRRFAPMSSVLLVGLGWMGFVDLIIIRRGFFL